MILHLTSESDWENAQAEGEYRCSSLYTEGFIHLSTIGQIVHVANSLYRNLTNPVVLVVSPNKLGGSLKWEGEGGHSFPHLYRSLYVTEVFAVIPWPKKNSGEYELTPDLKKMTSYLSLETERLVLREFDLRDAQAINRYASDEDLVKYMPWGPNDMNATVEFLSRNFKAQTDSPRTSFDFAIVEKETNLVIGGAGLFLRSGSTQTGYIGYILQKGAHGRGYATEVSQRLLKFGFEEFNLHRIEATCDSENVASYRVMERLGMQKEGVLRDNMYVKGRRRSTLIYSILKNEFNRLN